MNCRFCKDLVPDLPKFSVIFTPKFLPEFSPGNFVCGDNRYDADGTIHANKTKKRRDMLYLSAYQMLRCGT